MSIIESQSLIYLLAEYEKRHGRVFSGFKRFPEGIQIELLKQAKEGRIELTEACAKKFFRNTELRLGFIERILPFVAKLESRDG